MLSEKEKILSAKPPYLVGSAIRTREQEVVGSIHSSAIRINDSHCNDKCDSKLKFVME